MQLRRIMRPARAAFLVLLTGAVGACDNALSVELPGNVTEEGFYQPQSAPTLINSVIADFECSYSMFTVTTAGMEDAWWRATGYWTGWAEYREDRPNTGECATGDTSESWSTGFQKSRYMAETAYELIGDWDVPNKTQYLATAATYAGLVYQIFGETYCELTVDVGPLLQPAEVLAESEAWFTRALDQMGTGDFSIVSTSSLKQLALLGRARVRLAMGDLAGAQADAEKIQPDFIAYVTRDASVRTRWNHIYRALNVQGYSAIAGPVQWQGGVAPFTGYRNLTIGTNGVPASGTGVEDTRVPVEFKNEFLQDGVTDNYAQQKYTSLDAPIPLARYAEAQLILAEIQGGAAAVQHINNVREQAGLPRYNGPTDPATISDLIIEEKRRTLFLEGRFLAEKLRKDLWFPLGVGANHKDFTYGMTTCFMMPLDEYQNNPNIPPGYEGPR